MRILKILILTSYKIVVLGRIWCGQVRYGEVRCGGVWYVKVWRGCRGMGVERFSYPLVVKFGKVRWGVVRCGAVR
jgi:hypothetical protein